jgi:two-component system, cell cycle sensor histidine kinase and response regulator CckA
MGSGMTWTILVVDDDRPIANVLADLLCDEGYDVRTAYDGQAALREIEREPVDLIVSDVSMPTLDGPTLVRRLRERGESTPVILMSAVYQDIDIPGVEFMPKPFDVGHLANLVARVVGQSAVQPVTF